MSVSMETVLQTYLRCVETGSLRLKVHQERVKDRRTIMETGWRARGMIEATGSSGLRALIRVGHTAQTSSPWHDIIWWKLSLRMKRRRREAPIINGSQKMVASVLARHVSGARQTRHVCSYTHTHTHTQPTQTGRPVRDATRQSKQRLPTTPSQRWHNPKSTWLKLDLSNSAQTVSVRGESFRPEWRHSGTLLIATDSLWQVWVCVCVCVYAHISIHSPSHTQYFFVRGECYCWY